MITIELNTHFPKTKFDWWLFCFGKITRRPGKHELVYLTGTWKLRNWWWVLMYCYFLLFFYLKKLNWFYTAIFVWPLELSASTRSLNQCIVYETFCKFLFSNFKSMCNVSAITLYIDLYLPLSTFLLSFITYCSSLERGFISIYQHICQASWKKPQKGLQRGLGDGLITPTPVTSKCTQIVRKWMAVRGTWEPTHQITVAQTTFAQTSALVT